MFIAYFFSYIGNIYLRFLSALPIFDYAANRQPSLSFFEILGRSARGVGWAVGGGKISFCMVGGRGWFAGWR